MGACISEKELENSRAGIVSFVIAIADVCMLVAWILVGVVADISIPALKSEWTQAVAGLCFGCGLILGAACLFILSFAGVVCGIAGLVQQNRKRTLAIVGLVANALLVHLWLGFFALNWLYLSIRPPWDATP